MKTVRNLNHYFYRQVCPSFRSLCSPVVSPSVRPSVTKIFFHLNHLGITPRPPGLTPGADPGRIRGHILAPPEGLRAPELPGVNTGGRPQESGGDFKAI